MAKIKQKKYDIGDIVFVNEYNYNRNRRGDNHLFVIIGDDNEIVPLDYFGLIVSSHIEKSKQNSKYEYNEPLKKSNINNLSTDSIVKCDKLFNLTKDNIQFKIGTVDIDDYVRFIKAYNDCIDKTNNVLEDTSVC